MGTGVTLSSCFATSTLVSKRDPAACGCGDLDLTVSLDVFQSQPLEEDAEGFDSN